jgi:predicted TIM-barrel enzyme
MLRRANGTIVGSAVMFDGVARVDIARAKKLVER